MNDFLLISSWWFHFLIIGLANLPLTYFIFKKFIDGGYPFTKIIGVGLVSYLTWLLASLHIQKFSLNLIYLSIFICLALNFFVLLKFKKVFLEFLKSRFRFLLFEELVFFTALLFWSYVRGFRPEVEGLEKFMDFGFMNSILRSDYFPPLDMWMSDKTINYYYFGHLMAAVLTKFSQIKNTIAYNLAIASLFALTFIGSFSLGGNLITSYLEKDGYKYKKLLKIFLFSGILAAFLITLGGNLHALYYFFSNHFSFKDYWFPDATRFIVEKFGANDNTIHEFPIYSFVVADLHGHLSDVPFVLLFLATVIAFFISDENRHYFSLTFSPAFSLLLAIMYMTNSWDFPIYLIILGVVAFFIYFQKDYNIQTFYKLLGFGVGIVAGAIFLSLPFHLNFEQIAEGIGFVTYRSPFWQLLVLWGFPWFLIISYIVLLILKKQFNKNILYSHEIFVFIIASVSTILIIIPEIIYVKDIYIASYQRANTVFKLVYQSFILYGLVSTFILIKFFINWKNLFSKIILVITFLPLIFLIFYPINSIRSYYGNLKKYQQLDGIVFLNSSPEDLEGIMWLEKNISGQPTVLEAVGDSYTTFERVSAITGLPTVEGWLVHEWLWRGGFDEPQKRSIDVEKIYSTTNEIEAKTLLSKYNVKYIFVGSKEKEAYKVSEEKFRRIAKIVFSSGGTRIYQVGLPNN